MIMNKFNVIVYILGVLTEIFGNQRRLKDVNLFTKLVACFMEISLSLFNREQL